MNKRSSAVGCSHLKIVSNAAGVEPGSGSGVGGGDGAELTLTTGTLVLNVGGTVNQVKWDTIDKFPKSRLQKLRYATSESK